MKFNELLRNGKDCARRTGLFAKSEAPYILPVLGVVTFFAAAISACFATAKLPEVMEEHEAESKDIHAKYEAEESTEAVASPEMEKEISSLTWHTAKKVLKIYAKPIVLAAGATAMVLTGTKMSRARNIAAAGTITALTEGWNGYRERVKELIGEKAEHDIYNGIRREEVTETVVREDGTTEEVKKQQAVVDDDKPLSPYIFFWTNASRYWDDYCMTVNKERAFKAQAKFNDLLRARGYVFLNEILEYFDIPKIAEGQFLGWIYDPNDPKLHNKVDFGLLDGELETVVRFINCQPTTYAIFNFNLDGDISHDRRLFMKQRYEK